MFQLHPIKQELKIESIHAIYYSELNKNHFFKGEVHDFWEFLYVDTGHVLGDVVSNNFFLEKSYGMLIKPNDFHNLYCNGKDASNIVNFSFKCDHPKLLEVANKVEKLSAFQTNLLKSMIALLELPKKNLFELNLYTAISTDNFGRQQMVVNLLETFILDYVASATSDHRTSKPNLIEDTQQVSKEAEKIISVINSNINSKIDLDFISNSTGYSPERIRKILRLNFDIPLKLLVNQIKIAKAKLLLRESEMNISEISDFLGFSRVGYFSDVFYNTVGLRPMEYISSLKK